MTKDEAEALAFKREQHKSKYMSDRRWAAVHDSVKGWHVALVSNHAHVVSEAQLRAVTALRGGNLGAFMDAASDALLARCRAVIDEQAHAAVEGE